MRLGGFYDRLFGAGARRGHLDAGFYLIVGGSAVTLVALGLFLTGEARTTGRPVRWRETAIALAAFGAPLALLGISWSLPGRLALRAMCHLGAAASWVTVLFFLQHYPRNFNVPGTGVADHAPALAAAYLTGATVLLAGILTQIVGMYVRRWRAEGEGGDDWAETEYEVPEWVVERDIEEAMNRYPVEWGAAPRLESLQVDVPDQFDEPVTISGRGHSRRVRVAATGLDDASQRLRGLHDETVSVDADDADDALSALRGLRADMAAHPKQYRMRRPWYERLWRWLKKQGQRLTGRGRERSAAGRDRHERLRHAAEEEEAGAAEEEEIEVRG